MNPRQLALQVLCITDPAAKAEQARRLYAGFDLAALDTEAAWDEPPSVPGRPERPLLVPPKDVPMRSPFTPEGRAALLHAVTHIEFNAIKIIYNESFRALDGSWHWRSAISGSAPRSRSSGTQYVGS